MKIRSFFDKIKQFDIFLSIASIAVYCIQAFYYAYHQASQLDEGSYLIKGYEFVAGIYKPFQDYGPWTNKMPLSFYIPGIVQYWFGPGLRAGRYFAIFIAILMLIGCGLMLRKQCGKWWAVLGMWLIAINPGIIKTYSLAISEGIVACELIWTLYFLTLPKQTIKNIIIATTLSVIVVLTRQNMVLLVPILVLCYFWWHGKRAGWISLAVAAILLLAGHLIFYPKILTLWYPWIPSILKPLFEVGTVPHGDTPAWLPLVTLSKQLSSIYVGISNNFSLLLGFAFSFLYLVNLENWKKDKKFKVILGLFILFLVLFLMHAWASLGQSYCVGCFSNYLGFFYPLGVVIAILILKNILEKSNRVISILFLLIVLISVFALMMVDFAGVQQILQSINVPRMKGMQIQAGSTSLWGMIFNKFGGDEAIIMPMVSMLGLVIMAVIVFFISWLAFNVLKKSVNNHFSTWSFLSIANLVFFISAALLASVFMFKTDNQQSACQSDVIADYEKVGQQLNQAIEPDKWVYWGGRSVVTPLLYLPQAKLFPPQLNGIYSMWHGGDRDTLEKFGLYNDESYYIWRERSDYILINNSFFTASNWRAFLAPINVIEYARTAPIDSCNPDSFFRIYKKIK